MKSIIITAIFTLCFASFTADAQTFKFEKKIKIGDFKIGEFSVSAKNNTPWILTTIIDGTENMDEPFATGESFKGSVIFTGDRCETTISFNAYTKDGTFVGSTKEFSFKKNWKDQKNFSTQVKDKDIK